MHPSWWLLGFQLPVDPSPNPAVHRIDDADKVIGLIPPEYPSVAADRAGSQSYSAALTD